MGLLDLHVELAVTNELLKRIADALDRLSPITTPPDHSQHPLIGPGDVSRMTNDRAAKLTADRATMPMRASERVRFSDNARNPVDERGAAPATTSETGQWDHDDPLDALDEFDRQWDNYPGVPNG